MEGFEDYDDLIPNSTDGVRTFDVGGFGKKKWERIGIDLCCYSMDKHYFYYYYDLDWKNFNYIIVAVSFTNHPSLEVINNSNGY